jgi:hypothetical protein
MVRKGCLELGMERERDELETCLQSKIGRDVKRKRGRGK